MMILLRGAVWLLHLRKGVSAICYRCLPWLSCCVGDTEHKSKRRAPPIPPPTTSPTITEQINDAVSTSQSQAEQVDEQKEQVKQETQVDKQQQKQEDEQQQKQEEKQQEGKHPQQDSSTAVAEDTSSYVVIEKKIEDIIKEFDSTVGAELVEAIRTKLVHKHYIVGCYTISTIQL